jgi:MFS family permease
MNRDTRLVGIALLLWGFGEGLFFHIEPLYIAELGATPVQIGSILALANVVRGATYLPAGLLADRVPRKWFMVGGWVTGLLGVLLVASARSWQTLIPGLLIYAISAYCMPVINTYLAHAVGGRRVARAITLVFAGYAAGGVVSPAVGGWLAGVTSMRAVYVASAVCFAISTAIVVNSSPQPVPTRTAESPRWTALLNPRFLRFAGFASLIFGAMYLAFPLAPNYLQGVGGWSVARIGALGSFQALGNALLNPFLGRLADEDRPDAGRRGWLGRARALIMGPGLVWASILVLLLARNVPLLIFAFLLRGGYFACRSLVQAYATRLAREADRGLLLGATDTVIAVAQVVAPYLAGWLYAAQPAYPFLAALGLIPLVLVVSIAAGGLVARRGRVGEQVRSRT